MRDPDYDDEATFWREQRAQTTRTPLEDDAFNRAIRAEAEQVRCRHCAAPIGQQCRNQLADRPLKRLPCHPIRITDARKATQ